MDHKEELFEDVSDVGIYLQIPLYNQTVEEISEDWLDILVNSNCGIREEKILLLNNPRNWRTFFEARHSIPANALKKTRQLDTWSILTDTIVPSENFQELLDSAHAVLQKSKIEYLLFGHLGDCHLHFHLIPTQEEQPEALKVYDKIVEKSAELGGVYSAEHGTGKRKRLDFIKCYGKEAVKQIRRTKAALDPDFILNRGNVIEYESHNMDG
jgi:D-lactate dehydrogenase (cytochrome)